MDCSARFSAKMVFEIRNKITFPHGKGIWVLISDRFEENLISSRLAKRLSQDHKIQQSDPSNIMMMMMILSFSSITGNIMIVHGARLFICQIIKWCWESLRLRKEELSFMKRLVC